MKKLQIAGLALFLIAFIAMLAMQSDWGKRLAQTFLLEALSESGFQVEIGKFEGTFPHAVDLKDVKIESDTLRISIDTLDTRVSLLALLKKELLFTDVSAKGISYRLKPGSTPSFGKGKGLSFSVRVKHFQLSDVSIPDGTNPNIITDFDGALRVGKRNKDFYLFLSATRPGFPNSKAHITAYWNEAGWIQLKGSLGSPTLKAIPLPFPFDASADLQFALRGKKERLSGRVFGTLAPHSIAIGPLAPWVEKDWKIDSRIELKSQGWKVSRLVATTDHITMNGSAMFSRNGEFETAALLVKSNEPEGNAKFEIKAGADGALSVKGNAFIAKLPFDPISFEKVEAHAELLWKNNALNGSGVAAATWYGKTWKGKTEIAWENGGSLFLTHAALQGPAVNASGDLEIRPDKILIGQTDLNVENLQEFPFGIYGKLQGKTDWLVSNGKQVLTADLTATGFYWKDLFVEKVAIDASIIEPFANPQGRALLQANDMKWRQMFLDRFSFETLIGTPNWPFALSASGTWKRPLELNLSGIWHYGDAHLTSTLQMASGSFYNHPIALKNEVDIEIAPDLFRITGLDLTFSGARAYLALEESKNDMKGELILEKFPLDVLSLNPLDVSIAGQTDLTVSVNEKNGKVDGALKAKIRQMVVADPGETPSLRSASGHFDGRFDNERLDLNGSLQILDNTPLVTLDLSIPIRIEMMPFRAWPVYDQGAQGHFAFKGRIEEILDFFDLGTHRIEGDMACDFNLSRTLMDPEIRGKLHFEKGTYENYLTGTRLMDIKAEGQANGDRFTLNSFTASDGNGSLAATGNIDLLPKEYFPFLFDISFTRLTIAQIDLVSAEAEGKIQIAGNLKSAIAKGQIEVVQSDLHVPDRIPRSLPNLIVVYRNAAKPVSPPALPSKAPYPLELDLEVNAPEGIFIDGRGLDSEWKGRFHLGGTYTSLKADGKLELIKGEFLFLSRRFKLLDGSLSFTGKEHEMPHLNLAAQIEVKDVSITARLKGPLNNPQLTFQSVPPLPLSTIMSYLLFGQQLAEINSFQALQLANSLASLAGQGPDVLESTRKALGVDRLNIVSIPSGEPEIEDTIAVQVGKYISEGVLVSLTQGAEESSTNINIEIELKNGWVIQLESDQRQEQGKFTVKWNHNY